MAVGTVAAVVNPFTIALFCHFAPRFPLANLSLIFLIFVSSWRHQGPFKTHDLLAHGIKPSSLWPLQFGSSPGNPCLLWDQGITPVTGTVSIYSLCLDSQAVAVSTATTGGLDPPFPFSLNFPQGSWVKGGREESSHWSSALELLMVRKEDDISSLNRLFRRQPHESRMFPGNRSQEIWVAVLVLPFTHCVSLSKSSPF